MNVSDHMKKHGLTDEALDAMATPYETGDFQHEDLPVYSGSHLDAVGKKRVTVVYDAIDTAQVAAIARNRGVKPSEVYRDAMREYLNTHKRQLA